MSRVLWDYSFDLDWSIKWAVRLRHVGSSPGALSCGRVHVCLEGGRGLFQLPQICCATRAERKHVAAACRGANFMSESAPDDMKVTGDTRAAELYLLFGIEARSFKCHNATQPFFWPTNKKGSKWNSSSIKNNFDSKRKLAKLRHKQITIEILRNNWTGRRWRLEGV